MCKGDVARCGPEERYSSADDHGYACDDGTLNQSYPKKPLDGDPAIHVDVVDAADVKLRPNSSGGADICSTNASVGARWSIQR